MSSNYGGIHWDNTNRIYEISGGSIKVKDTPQALMLFRINFLINLEYR